MCPAPIWLVTSLAASCVHGTGYVLFARWFALSCEASSFLSFGVVLEDRQMCPEAAVLTLHGNFFLFAQYMYQVFFISCRLCLGQNVVIFGLPLLAATALVLAPVNYRTYPTNGTKSTCKLYQGGKAAALFCCQIPRVHEFYENRHC